MAKIQQVFRTAVPTTSVEGTKIPPSVRVVVVNPNVDGKVKVKVADPKRTEFAGAVIVASEGAFRETKRGRPPKAKAAKAVKQDSPTPA